MSTGAKLPQKRARRPQLFGRDVATIHCVGIGGMGVAPLAIFLTEMGFHVSGQDDALPEDVGRLLRSAGIEIGALPSACDLVVISSAIGRTHAASLAASNRGLPLVRRGELLAEIARERKLVAVCGSHGKTTTTAMIIAGMRAAGFPAGYILGGLLADGSAPAAAGTNEWLVAEIDESDGTIGLFSPHLTVLVNLDWDHPDHYRRREDLEHTFAGLLARTTGTALIDETCAMSAGVSASAPGEVRTFGRTGDFAGAIAAEEADAMTLSLGGRFSISDARVRARGGFNAANATAALAALALMGVEMRASLLAGYTGVKRRQTVLRIADGITVIEDYAHHPAEIRALLGSLRSRVAPGGRLVVVFQPHRYSRTAQFKTEFAAALLHADRLHLLDVYPAGEAPVAGGTTADIRMELQRRGPGTEASYFPGDDAGFFKLLTREARAGDVIAFVGAGDIDRRAREWLATNGGAQ